MRVEGLRFAWDDGPPVLDGVSFELAPGDVLSLLGPNGSGKTTLLRCVLGLTSFTNGSVELHGRDASTLTATQMAREVAYVPQSVALVFPFAVFDVVLMGRSPHLRFMASPTPGDRQLAQDALERLGIGHLGARRFNELSGGERQLVLIARALAQGSKVLVMDEPCASLDLGNQVHILHIIRTLANQGFSILLSSHLPDHVFWLGGRVALLADGRLCGPGAPQEIVTASALSALYRTPIDVVRIADGSAAGQRLCIPIVDTAENGDADICTLRPATNPDRADRGKRVDRHDASS